MQESCNAGECSMLPRIEALERDNERNKEAHKEFYAKFETSHTAVALIEARIGQIKADTEEIKESVRELKDKPGKRWESLVGYALSALAGAFLLWLSSGMPGIGK